MNEMSPEREAAFAEFERGLERAVQKHRSALRQAASAMKDDLDDFRRASKMAEQTFRDERKGLLDKFIRTVAGELP
jgi:hypothetical protein